MKGRLSRDASGRLFFSGHEVEARAYEAECRRVAERFDLVAQGERLAGIDLVSQRYAGGEGTVVLEWDNWCGFMVVAEDPGAEPLVRRISLFLDPDVDHRSAV